MLKPMKPQTGMPRNLFLWILVGLLVISGVIALVSAFGGGDDGADEVNAVYTNAAATVAAQQQGLLPASPTATAAGTPTATATFLALPTASPTLFTNPSIPTTSSGSSSGGSGAVGCNNSVFVSDVTYPDNTVVTPGQAIKKTWKLQNTGSCAWTPTYKVTFISGSAMGGVATAIGITVASGASGDVTVDMIAPATAGEVIGYWILTNDSGQNFGSNFYVQVKVGGTTTGTAVTSTPGATTPTVTATSVTTAPTAANNPTVTLTCTSDGGVTPQYKFSGTLAWEDLSSDETGFRIYINGVVVNTTSANATSYAVPESAFMPAGTPLVFGVEAFNVAGSATTATVSSQCP
ncbi:MAG: hypothetical protein HYZ24_01995 [Chloroflexi bacterium]|jgi:hypothetical protein|nr:hypothetical protein [Chloroflexota bacterium]